MHIEYSTSEWTSDDVIVTLKPDDENEKYIVINNEGKNEYIFTKNDTFTFEVQDEAGN